MLTCATNSVPFASVELSTSFHATIFVGVWYRRRTTGRTAQCFWDDDDVDRSSMVHPGHDETTNYTSSGCREAQYPTSCAFMWLYCSRFRNYKWVLRVGDEGDDQIWLGLAEFRGCLMSL
jgi:hypothetical protein